MTNNKQVLIKTLKSWLPLAAVVIILSGLVYATVQQTYRQNANDPQIQVAEDIADAISQGLVPPEAIVSPAAPTTDLKKSLSTFILIYDDSNKLIASSAALDGKSPDYPKGVLDSVKAHGEDRVTWQPQAGVRMATVVTRYTGKQSGFVVVGRSLKEVEKRVARLTAMTAVATAVALIISLLLIFLFKMMWRPSGEHHKHTEIVIDTTKE